VIGLDTNVLVRLLVEDDVEQTRRAIALLEQARTGGEMLYLDPVVMVETAWVLRSFYHATSADIAEAITSVLGNTAYEIGDRPAIEAALRLYQDSKADFADCLIAARNLAVGCRHTITFDAKAASLAGMSSL
jgi:predicted nucleic-acid-binding protein